MPHQPHPPWFHHPNKICREHKSLRVSLCYIFQHPVTSSLLDSNIPFNTLFSNTLILYSSLTRQTKITEKSTILHILIPLDNQWRWTEKMRILHCLRITLVLVLRYMLLMVTSHYVQTCGGVWRKSVSTFYDTVFTSPLYPHKINWKRVHKIFPSEFHACNEKLQVLHYCLVTQVLNQKGGNLIRFRNVLIKQHEEKKKFLLASSLYLGVNWTAIQNIKFLMLNRQKFLPI